MDIESFIRDFGKTGKMPVIEWAAYGQMNVNLYFKKGERHEKGVSYLMKEVFNQH